MHARSVSLVIVAIIYAVLVPVRIVAQTEAAVKGESTNTSVPAGVYGEGPDYGVWGSSAGWGVYGSSPNIGVYGSGNVAGLYGYTSGTSGSFGVYGRGDHGIRGEGNSYGVHGSAVSSGSKGVYGRHTTGWWGTGVYGTASGFGGRGVYGEGTDVGVYGMGLEYGGSPAGWAGYFIGNVFVSGNLSKSSGSFVIDHPLDPENKYLYHSFVESPDMKNVYDGVVVLDQFGEASIELPEWFEALNRDFRYQLTCIGEFAPVYVADKIQQNRFRVAGGKPGMEVSWLVTGIRRDPYAESYRIPVEEEKLDEEKGKYLVPDVYGKGEEHRIHRLPRVRRIEQ